MASMYRLTLLLIKDRYKGTGTLSLLRKQQALMLLFMIAAKFKNKEMLWHRVKVFKVYFFENLIPSTLIITHKKL